MIVLNEQLSIRFITGLMFIISFKKVLNIVCGTATEKATSGRSLPEKTREPNWSSFFLS